MYDTILFNQIFKISSSLVISVKKQDVRNFEIFLFYQKEVYVKK